MSDNYDQQGGWGPCSYVLCGHKLDGGGGEWHSANFFLLQTSYLGKHSGKDLVKSFAFQNICCVLITPLPWYRYIKFHVQLAREEVHKSPPQKKKMKKKKKKEKKRKMCVPLEYEQVPYAHALW